MEVYVSLKNKDICEAMGVFCRKYVAEAVGRKYVYAFFLFITLTLI